MSSNFVAEKIKKLIKSKKWTIAEAAHKSGIKHESLKNLIYGRSKSINLNLIESLANALECDINFLIKNTKIDENKNGKLNLNIYREALELIDSYLLENNLELDKAKLIRAADNITDFLTKKRRHDPSFQIDKDIIKLIFNSI